MGWTVKPSRRNDRLRRRPHLENLDDRCLLSTGLDGTLSHVAANVRHAHTNVVRAAHVSPAHARAARHLAGHHAQTSAAAHRERPAGTISVSSAGANYDSTIGASQVQSAYGVNGSGMTVAVIDTGIDSNNPAFGGGFGPGAKVVAGFDFSNPANANPALASNANHTSTPHGTGVAGLIGSSNPADPGVAPGVNLVDLKVTDASGTANLQSIANALQWVVNNHAQYNITVVNLSLSDGQNYAHNWFAFGNGVPAQVTSLIGQLRGMNIPVVVATGNSFNGSQGEGFAAIVQGTISVTATDTAGQILPDAQRLGANLGGGSATVIAAPGQSLTVPMGDSGMASGTGTSFAAPLVSGSIVLLQQIYANRFGSLPSVDQIQSWLQNGSNPIYDPATGITIGGLNIPKAAARIPTPAVTTPVVSTTPVVTTPVVTTPTPSRTVTAVSTTTTPAPAPTPAPAQAQVLVPPPSTPTPASPSYVVYGGSSGDSVSNATDGTSGTSGLATLLKNMRIWQATRLG